MVLPTLESINTAINWHFCGLLLIMILSALAQKTKQQGIVIMTVVSLPGVILHEAMHALAGTVLCAGINGLSLFPRYAGGGRWILGSVSCSRLNAFNAVPVGLAPLALVGIALVVYYNWLAFFTPNLFSVLGLYFSLFILLYESLPSAQDLKVAFNIKSILLYGVIGCVGFLWVK